MKIYMYIFSIIICWGCANVILPTGGEKDISAPKILSTNPINKSIYFDADKIIIEFDEYIQLKNRNTIKISPICDPTPKITVRGKKIEIELLCAIDNEATYTINFGKSIVDLNEGNILENYQYVFSRGGKLDSLTLRGSVKDLYFNKKLENILVGLYQNFDSPTPYYYTFSNENGDFLIENIKNDNYTLFAFGDKNQNLQHDPDEIVSMTEQINDLTIIKNIGLFYENNDSDIKNVKNIHRNAILFEHGVILDSIIVLNTSGVWDKTDLYSKFWFNSSPRFIKYQFNNVIDSVEIYNRDSVHWELNVINSTEDFMKRKKIIIKSNIPINNLITEKFLWKDFDEIVKPLLIDPFTIHIPVNVSVDVPQTLIIESDAMHYQNILKNDSISFHFNHKVSDYGSLKIKSAEYSRERIVELFREDKIIKKDILSDSLSLLFIQPGEYNLRIFHDLNNDHQWSPGQVNPIKNPELIKVYPELIKIKANWEIDIFIDSFN